MTCQKNRPVIDIERDATRVLAMSIVKRDIPRVYVEGFDTDSRAVYVDVCGASIRIVPKYDRIRHARVELQSSHKCVNPSDRNSDSYRTDAVVFTKKACDDPLDEFRAMTDDVIKASIDSFSVSFDVYKWYTDNTSEMQLSSAYRYASYDEDDMLEMFGIDDGRYAFDDLVEYSACHRSITVSEEALRDGGRRVRHIESIPSLINDRRNRNDTAAFLVCVDTFDSNGKFIKARCNSQAVLAIRSRMHRYAYGSVQSDWRRDTIRIMSAFDGTDFDVVSADIIGTQVTVRHPEYGDHTITRVSDHDNEFTVYCHDLGNFYFHVGIFEDDPFYDDVWEKMRDGEMTREQAEKAEREECDRRIDTIPARIAEAFEKNVVAQIGNDSYVRFSYEADSQDGTRVDGWHSRNGVYESVIPTFGEYTEDGHDATQYYAYRRTSVDEDEFSVTVTYKVGRTTDGGKTFETHEEMRRRVKELVPERKAE